MRNLPIVTLIGLTLAIWTCFLTPQASSAIVKYDFDVAWTWTSPKGLPARSLIGVNGKWPPPSIHAAVGDNVLVKVSNSLTNQSTSLHFHGLFMNGSANMDGTSYISQCEILPGDSFTYNFTVQQPGTYWYHSHQKSQYPDGLRGALIIQDSDSPYRARYNEEFVLTLSDWYNQPVAELLRHNYDDPSAARTLHDPLPDGNLINDCPDFEAVVNSNTTYAVRVLNVGAFAGQYLWFADHDVTITEVDGVYVEPVKTSMIHLGSGQRYSLLLTTKADGAGRFAITSQIDKGSFSHHETWTSDFNAMAWLVYNDELTQVTPSNMSQLTSINDMQLIPLDHEPLLSDVDKSMFIVIDMKKQSDGLTHWQFNTTPFQLPNTPLIHIALTPDHDNPFATTFLPQTPVSVLPHNAVVELVIHNKHMRKHPLHLHGHTFQIVSRSKGSHLTPIDPQVPPRRDTVIIESSETMTIRFRADNPGVWLFHCHMEWHAHSGLMLAFVEAEEELRKQEAMATLEQKLHAANGSICGNPSPDTPAKESLDEQIDPSNNESTSIGILFGVVLMVASIVVFTLVAGYTWMRRYWPAARSHEYKPVPLELDEE